ncbi:TPA: spore coat protein U domain-containing protein [Stenotrophomonas maltophilia]|nr:spore coat protein U domain-containing protein [Stenotrophomonas maltophilia]
MTRKTLLRALLPIALASLAVPAFAADTTADLTIQGTLTNTCQLSVTSIEGMDWSGISEAAARTSGLSIVCNAGTTYSISPGQGQNFGLLSGYETYRAVTNGAGAYIPYGFFKDPQGSQVWGDDTDAFTGVGDGTVQSYSYAVRFLALKQAVGGNYTDTVTVTAIYN